MTSLRDTKYDEQTIYHGTNYEDTKMTSYPPYTAAHVKEINNKTQQNI